MAAMVVGSNARDAGTSAGSEKKAGFFPAIRIPDPNFEGLHLFAGKPIGRTDEWRWYRLKDPLLSSRGVFVTVCEVVRVCDASEVSRLDEAVNRGILVLVHCYLNSELHIRVAK